MTYGFFLCKEELYKAQKTNVLLSYFKCKIFNMIHPKKPIELENAARASTRQQQRLQQCRSGPEFDSTATHSTHKT